MSARLSRRLSIVVLVCLVFGLAGTVAQAQLPVTDVLALAEKITQNVLQETTKAIRQLQAEKVYKMSIRLSEWVDLATYVIDAVDMPEWRIHCWFDACGGLYANDYLSALTYGDRSGAGYASVTVPRQDPSAAFTTGYTPKSQAIMRTYLASLDLLDSSIVRDTHVAGQYRFGGRDESEALIELQDMVLKKDPTESLASSLDQVSAAKIVTLQNKQARAAMETALLEQLAVEQVLDRETDVAVHNMIMTTLQAQGDEPGPPSVVAGATDALSNWHLR
jgi:hypothetical protein